ncbi:MAG TPA: AraC family transcriptional regulator, partial [Polyangiaceae bacterium]|nr:AraC family transcriptional regulator [Polyangiaceae bacterium]
AERGGNERPRADIRVFYAEPPLRSSRLSIHALGAREWMPPCIVYRPTGSGDYLIMAFNQPIELAPGVLSADRCLMIWEPTATQHYGVSDARWLHSWMHCAGRFIERQLATERIAPNQAILGFDTFELERCVEDIHREIVGNARADEMLVENLISNLLRKVGRHVHGTRGSEQVPPHYLELKSFIESHFADELELKQLARRVHASVPHFCSEFKRYFKSPAMDFVIRLRLYRARMLLSNQNLSINAIAREVGYEDLHYFSRLFKKRFGLSPRELRRKLLPESG